MFWGASMVRKRVGVMARARWRPAAVAVACVVTVSSCAPAAPPTPSPSLIASIPVATPTASVSPVATSSVPTPSPSSTLDTDQTAARETVLIYFQLLNDLSKDPELLVQPLADITTGQTQTLDIEMITEDREAGVIQTGDNSYYVTQVGAISNRGSVRVVGVAACTDSSGTDLVDETGESVLGPDRAYFVDWKIEVLHEGYGWKVGDITNVRVEKCGP